jgi:hypothetical protein
MILISVSPLASFAVAFLYRVWGYSVSTQGIRVHRTLFPVTLPLEPPVTVERMPGLVKGSLRTFGNGGLFGFYGRFWKSGIGSYRAFVTNPANVILVTTVDRRSALSPDQPEAFMRVVKEMAGSGRSARGESPETQARPASEGSGGPPSAETRLLLVTKPASPARPGPSPLPTPKRPAT